MDYENVFYWKMAVGKCICVSVGESERKIRNALDGQLQISHHVQQ